MRKKTFSLLIIFAAVMMIGYCSSQIITTLEERHLSKQEYEQTRESYVSVLPPREEETPPGEEEFVWNYDDGSEGTSAEEEEKKPEKPNIFPTIKMDIDGLLAENPDFNAWIYYEDADINYPITQETAAEINFYMKHTFQRQANPSGCVFIPYDADPGYRYMNTFVYGHNMANGTMFGGLKNVYQKPETATNPYFFIWTKDGQAIAYRVIAAYVVDKSSEMFSIPLTIETYTDYVNAALKLGAYNRFVLFTEEERAALKAGKPIVTLSTCYGPAGTSKRLLVQGVEIRRE